MDSKCLRIQLISLKKELETAITKSRQLEKSLYERTKFDSIGDNTLLEDELAQLKKLSARNLSPKVTQSILNLINKKHKSLYVHLYFPSYEKFEVKSISSEDEKSVAYKLMRRAECSVTGIKFIFLIRTFMSGTKFISTKLEIIAKCEKSKSVVISGKLSKITLSSGTENGALLRKLERFFIKNYIKSMIKIISRKHHIVSASKPGEPGYQVWSETFFDFFAVSLGSNLLLSLDVNCKDSSQSDNVSSK